MTRLLLLGAALLLLSLMLAAGSPFPESGSLAKERALLLAGETTRRETALERARRFHEELGEYLGVDSPEEPGAKRLFPVPPEAWREGLALFPEGSWEWETPAAPGGAHRLRAHGSFADLLRLLGTIDRESVPLSLEKLEMMRVGSRLTLVLELRPMGGEGE